MHVEPRPAYSTRPLFDLLSPATSPAPKVLSSSFPSPHEAWIWAVTAMVAAVKGDSIPGPCSPETVLMAAETAGWSRLEWHIANRVGLDGEPPEGALEAAVYQSAMLKLDDKLVCIAVH